MTDFKVQVEALRTAAGQFGTLSGQAGQQAGVLGAVRVGASDFGCLPGNAKLYQSYRSTLEQSIDSLDEAADGLEGMQQGLMETAGLYEKVEQQAQDAVNKYFGGI